MSDIKKAVTPDWSKKVVWYQVFPERFRNGDPSNQPKKEDQRGSWPHDYSSRLEPHPWNSDWYELQPWEKENELDIWKNIQRRRYGGDLQGIIDKLDYLQDLGIGALYLNPVFASPSHHKYDAICYHHVDPNFGPDPEADRNQIKNEVPHDPETWEWTSADKLLLQLIKEVHNRGMYIILDGVFNHMGLRSLFFEDLKKNGKNSLYADWFAVENWGDPNTGEGFKVKTWEGYNELPELREDKNGLVSGPRKYVFDITRRWMDPEDNGDTTKGIDGWRLDVAAHLKHAFWRDWRKHVKAINPEAYIVAELIDDVETQKPYLEGDQFDACMNYNFTFACKEFFLDEKSKKPVTDFINRLEKLRNAYPKEITLSMQNLLGSHDTDRVASRIINKEIARMRQWWQYYHKSKAENPKYDTRKPNEAERRIQKLMILFQMTYIGAPVVYYGDEAGMWGANDPCDRKPMVWPDINYEPEATLPDGSTRPNPDTVEFDHDLFEWHKKLIQIRNNHPALQTGDFEVIEKDNESKFLLFKRTLENNSVLVALNGSSKEVRFTIDEPVTDLINEKKVSGRITLEPMSGLICIT